MTGGRDSPSDHDIIEGARKEHHFVDRRIDQIEDAIGGFDLHGRVFSVVDRLNRQIALDGKARVRLPMAVFASFSQETVIV
jgi:hypothetical protein